jgi:hypothetical protein
MGMTCSLYRVTADELDQVIADPTRVRKLLGMDDGPPVREVRPKGFLGFLLRMTPVRVYENDPDTPYVAGPPPDPGREVDIEKGWHGLHFLLTGTADEGDEPSCFMVKGGEDLDDEGFGRALKPAQVRSFSEFLSGFTPETLATRYDQKRMTELRIYPFDEWPDADEEEDNPVEWLVMCFDEVQRLVKLAADSGDGLIIHTS